MLDRWHFDRLKTVPDHLNISRKGKVKDFPLEKFSILNENQSGFRKGYSTIDNIFVLYAFFELLKLKKRLLQWIKNQNCLIVFLQETHFNNESKCFIEETVRLSMFL
jgi:hypothetical protein